MSNLAVMSLNKSVGSAATKHMLVVRALVVKSIFDVLFVGVLVAHFYYTDFNPSFQGALDYAGVRGVKGWAVDQSAAGMPVEVQLYIDGRFVDSRLADYQRADLVTAGIAPDERHGFYFFLPPLEAGAHEARVYAARTGLGARRPLRLVGAPIRFQPEETPAEPDFRGWLDEANEVSVRGWVVRRAALDERVPVALYIDGHFIERRAADQSRPDLATSGIPGDGRHGFFFFTPSLSTGAHEARVYVEQSGDDGQTRTLRLIGRPLRFQSISGDEPDAKKEDKRP